MTAIQDRLEAEGISATKRREHGDPAEEILATAAEIDAEMIVMGASTVLDDQFSPFNR